MTPTMTMTLWHNQHLNNKIPENVNVNSYIKDFNADTPIFRFNGQYIFSYLDCHRIDLTKWNKMSAFRALYEFYNWNLFFSIIQILFKWANHGAPYPPGSFFSRRSQHTRYDHPVSTPDLTWPTPIKGLYCFCCVSMHFRIML